MRHRTTAPPAVDTRVSDLPQPCISAIVPGRPESLEIAWYADDLPMHAPTLWPNSQSNLSREFATAPGSRERKRIASAVLALIGFNTFAHMTFQTCGSKVVRAFLPKGYLPLHYSGHYLNERDDEIDPRVAFVRKEGMPIIWDLPLLRDMSRCDRNDPRISRFLQQMAHDEMNSGVMFPIHLPYPDLHAFVCLTSVSPTRNWITRSALSQALTLGLAVHEFLSISAVKLARQEIASGASHMERRILTLVASGLSDKEIASRLDTSVHNVTYHLRALRIKHDAANRARLAYLAGRFHLV